MNMSLVEEKLGKFDNLWYYCKFLMEFSFMF